MLHLSMFDLFHFDSAKIAGLLKTILLLTLGIFSLAVHAQPQDNIVFGIAHSDNSANLAKQYQPLINHIKQKLALKAELQITRNQADLQQKISAGTIHIAFLPAANYIQSHSKIKGLTLLAGATVLHPVNGKYRDHYRGLIVSLKSSGITTLAGLKQKRFGFTHKESAAGYKYPLHWFNENDVDPEQYFSHTFMLKKPGKIVQALVNNAIDGGAIDDIQLARDILQWGNIFNIIGHTDPIPYHTVVASPHCEQKVANRVKQLLHKLHPDSIVLQLMRQHGASNYGWDEAQDSHYNSLRQVLDSDKKEDRVKQLVLAISDSQPASLINKMWQPLIQHIAKQTTLLVSLQVVKLDTQLTAHMTSGHFDIGVFKPFGYIRAKDQLPQLHYLATVLKPYADGTISDHYNGVLISLKSSKIKNLTDLKNKRFAFTSKTSTSGYLYPLSYLTLHHIEPAQYFAQTFMLNRHSKVVKALLSRAIDAGATTDDELYRATIKYGDIFTLINETADIPFDAITAAPHLNETLRKTIKKAILSAWQTPAVKKALQQSQWKFHGFVERDDHFYDSVRHVRNSIKNNRSTAQ